MRLIFKDVGQGDSIVVEWFDNFGILQVGLIDCNLKNSTNPVLDHIKVLKKFDFHFIVLTHPHEDHFSGVYDLLLYLEYHSKILEYFLHTCFSHKEYLQASVKAISSQKVLFKIFQKASELHRKGLIKNYHFVNDFSKELPLEKGIFMQFLSPTQTLISKFNSIAFKNEVFVNNNPDANLLSTVIKVYSDKWVFLLTSDATKDIFWSINKKGYKDFNKAFLFGQIPHHGSTGNYYDTFWRLVKKNNNDSYACISVGENSYGHPSQTVLSCLHVNNYKVVQTLSKISKKASTITSSLNIVSTLISSNINSISKDIEFEITNDICTLL